MYALIDSNNFFVSCERLFRPDLETRPIVVLSSNDGCAVSRSNEAKALGIPMGAPAFKYRDVFRQHGVVSFSANFELYGDISERISSLLATITPRIEVYSVDESFLDLSELNITDYEQWGRAVRAQVLHDIGIPVSIGIAPTKTLCKIANHWAKKHPETRGALFLTPNLQQGEFEEILEHTPIQDIWGVGWRLAPQLRAEGVMTALDLAHMRPGRAGQLMGVHGRQMQAELNGTRCLPLQTCSKPQQMIARGRQFGADTADPHTIEAAIVSLTSRAARELRREHQLTCRAAVILRTNRTKPGYAKTVATTHFEAPTADTGKLSSYLVQEATRALRDHRSYHKAEVVLYDLVDARALQTDVFGLVDTLANERSATRMQVVDTVGAKYGSAALRPAAELLSTAWRPRSNSLSPHYTSNWGELPEATIKVAKNF